MEEKLSALIYYVKNICVAHNWQIQVNSEPGKGTEFTITIPKIGNS
jgi:signal transduction histidine kinase